jgi:molybdopterin converting factor subunit 1
MTGVVSDDDKIKVKLFAVLKEAVGKKEIIVAVPSGATLKMLKNKILQEYPALNSFSNKFILSVNLKVATDDTIITPGDEIAILPPVSGG